MEKDTLVALAADIVRAHVAHNTVPVEALPQLIAAVYAALAGLGQPDAIEEEPRIPAVSVRTSVKPGALTCLECGAKLKMLKRHLQTEHALSPHDYRARWQLPTSYPMVAADYLATRQALAKKLGLGRKRAINVGGSVEAPAPTNAAEAPIEPATKSARARKKLGISA